MPTIVFSGELVSVAPSRFARSVIQPGRHFSPSSGQWRAARIISASLHTDAEIGHAVTFVKSYAVMDRSGNSCRTATRTAQADNLKVQTAYLDVYCSQRLQFV